MGDSSEKQAKPSFWKGLKSEYKKITWPDRKSTIKQSVVVAVISIILGLIIALLDYVFKYGVNFLASL
ncbi:MAG: preprotein translocase subunit SecE [Lachnospiraceae bacterium]|nr:preprotein translocase subunit SecE [Lachnospiraceae bacterium]MBO7340695.1 preprotein translocase subunit SecE [Lachnospiraceae bacterium]MBP5264617.1 preprotein translocase subunit SecE [Lachnospiraceae bacterium]MBR3469766.1 preprotein translocase subunit SecE [Lachnospiraceae bacterium]MCR4775687.1 preprotein translocase subunit SecE [Saccharofermentans sp.]